MMVRSRVVHAQMKIENKEVAIRCQGTLETTKYEQGIAKQELRIKTSDSNSSQAEFVNNRLI